MGKGYGFRARRHREIKNVPADTGKRRLVATAFNAEPHLRQSELTGAGKSWDITPVNFSVTAAIKGNLSPMRRKTLDESDTGYLSIEECLGRGR